MPAIYGNLLLPFLEGGIIDPADAVPIDHLHPELTATVPANSRDVRSVLDVSVLSRHLFA